MKKNIETIKKNQSEMKTAISKIKNTLEGINRRMDEAEDRISNLEDKVAENTQSGQQEEKRIFKNEYTYRPLGQHEAYQYLRHKWTRRRRKQAQDKEAI